MAGGFDYREYKKYRNNFMRFYKQFTDWLTQFVYLQGLKFIAQVKDLTPVDTGDLRDHWQLDDIVVNGENVECWFINPMEYATHVEYGHAKPYKSGQADPGYYEDGRIIPGDENWVNGSFMMTISLETIERELPAEFEQAFLAFANRMGVK